MPLTLTTGGVAIAGVSADITFDTSVFEFVGCTIPADSPAALAGKTCTSNTLEPGVVRVGIFSDANTDPIGDGIVAILQFTLKRNPVGGIDIIIAPGASDPAGNPVLITSSVTGGFYTAKTGDIDRNGTVTIGELLQGVSMFLGIQKVDQICDPGGDGKVQINDVIKIVNCYLETPECACDSAPTIPYEELWAGSGHADASAEAFNHWNKDGEIPTTCAKCHSTPGYQDYLGADGTPAGVVNNPAPTGTVINCDACHNNQASDLTSVTFPSGAVVSGLGSEARCIVCHQGIYSGPQLNTYIAGKAMTDPDAVDATASFTDVGVHYMAAGATQYGTIAKGGYQYPGMLYDSKFAHAEGYETCITCHDPHSLEVKKDKCVTCHTGLDLTTKETLATTLHEIRMKGSLVDYDGDDNITEGIYAELEGVKAKLMQVMQAYATAKGSPIVYSSTAYPYFFKDTNANGIADPSEATFGNKYNAFTARLLKAAYNYQFAMKDGGAYAHGGKYVIELLYDSITDVNAGLTTPVNVGNIARTDEGHFNSSTEAWRHWDAEASVPASCAKCHSAKGIPFFLANYVTVSGVNYGFNIAEPQATSGMLCTNCHQYAKDNDAPRIKVRMAGTITSTKPDGTKGVVFPSALVAYLGDDSDICLLCHQGRAWKGTVDTAVPTPPATKISFKNIHYYAAAASMFGTQVKGGYEFSDAPPAGLSKIYSGQNLFSGHGGSFDTCVECHMGTKSLDPANRLHYLAQPSEANCVCHAFDTAQSATDLFGGIRKTTADLDGDGNTAESLESEIQGLEGALYTQIKTYAKNTANNGAIVYDGATNPYWFKDDSPEDGIPDVVSGKLQSYLFNTDRVLLKACYNYQVSKKEPHGYIHNAKYIAQLLIDSIQFLGGNVAAYPRPTP